MAITIVATAGAANSNSFVTEVEQIAYMAARLNASAWTTTTGSTLTDTENIALVEATREITLRAFIGLRVDNVQALAWPRQYAPDPDDPYGNYFDMDEIPQRVKDATSELAFQFIKAGTTDVAAIADNAGIKRQKIDVLETEYFEYAQPSGLARYPRVAGYLAPLLAYAGALTAPLVKG